ncbi:WD40 repeat domain-containing protein [Kitasatospora sp. MMS16-BH015]|uniref:WD40 repeat domain-containing protein n=1 Tax=Kitasatospora sp. MMS16-BH015 TaxID=2018025 RepID=UPI001C2C3FE8|nr:hypothetical protein [Kitasatospora sp. MMS16-BH015]
MDDLELSTDRTAAVVCRSGADTSTVSLLRISDGAPQGRPFTEQDGKYKTDRCLSESVDATGSRVVLSGMGATRVVDLTKGEVISTVPADDHTYGTHALAEAAGRLYEVAWDGAAIFHTELPLGAAVLSVSQQRITPDGTRTLSILADGSGLQLRPAAEADSDKLLAEAARRKPYWKPTEANPAGFSRDGTLLADQEGKNVVSVREAATLREVAAITAADFPPLPAPEPADPERLFPPAEAWKWSFADFFDTEGKILTVSGSVVQRWEPRTGRELARFDVMPLLPAGKLDVMFGPYPAPNEVALIVLGDRDVRIVDITTGKVAETISITDDVLSVQFDRSGRYMALLRRGSILELWRRHPLRRELGPLQSISESVGTPFVASFLDEDGRYLLASNNTVRTYQVGQRAPLDSYEFGAPPGESRSSYRFMDTTRDGRTLIYSVSDGPGGPLVLDPSLWQTELCRIIGYRDFTEEERAGLPTRLPAAPPCGVPGRPQG